MCTNQRQIINKYTGAKLFVKCGKCPACLQEKAAHRVSRIKANDSDDTETFLLTLTYRNECVPYVRRDDAYLFSRNKFGLSCDFPSKVLSDGNRIIIERSLKLPVFRDMDYRWIRADNEYNIKLKPLGQRIITYVDFSKQCDFNNLKDLNKKPNCIGVCYYPDLQNFVSKLRINLKRFYNVEYSFKTFCCSEYGTKKQRPHFHLLLWIPKGTSETFRSAIIKSWPYGDIQNHPKRFERAFRASSYVASYVNKPNGFPDFLKTYFDCSHSYSKYFGLGRPDFLLSSILSKFHRGHLTMFKQKDEFSTIKYVECPLPSYVIFRFFPKFKGYNRIAPSSLCQFTKRLVESDFLFKKPIDGLDYVPLRGSLIWYSRDDIHKISVRLRNAFDKFNSHFVDEKFSFDDYLRLHKSIWQLYNSDVLRLSMCNYDIPLPERYDNLEDVKIKVDRQEELGQVPCLPIGFSKDMLVVTNPNDFASVKCVTNRFETSFYDNIKHRSVNEVFLTSQDDEF